MRDLSARLSWAWGSSRLWIDETLNQVLAVSRRHVAARGSHSIQVWRRADGERVLRLPWREHPIAPWLDDARDLLGWYTPTGRVQELSIPAGALMEREAQPEDPRWPAIAVDRMGSEVSVRWPEGHVCKFIHRGELVTRIACAPEAGLVAIPHGLRAVDVCDGRTGARLQVFAGPWEAALSRDGAEVVLGAMSRSRLTLGEVASGAIEELDLPTASIDALRFSPDGSRLLVIAGGRGWLLDARDGRALVRLRPCPSPRTLGVDAIDEIAAFSADGEWIVGSAKHQIVRWSARTGEVDRRIELDPRSKVHALSCDARGERVAITGADYPGGLMLAPWSEARVWDLGSGREVARVVLEDAFEEALELSPAGDRLAVVKAGTARVAALPASPGGPVQVGPDAPWSGFAADALREAWSEDGLVLTLVGAGAAGAELAVPGAVAFGSCAERHVFAVGFPEGRVELRGLDGSTWARLEAPAEVLALALAPGGRTLAVGGRDGFVRAYSAAAEPAEELVAVADERRVGGGGEGEQLEAAREA